jgi:magnesium-transporting ATPase (P-type)
MSSNAMTDSPRTTWHALTSAEACSALDVTEEGLGEAEAVARLQRYGHNAIPHRAPPAWWQIFVAQFRNPIIYILGLAAIGSVVIGHASDAGFIGVVVLINALIGGYQEHRAERSARALQQLLRTRAYVLRDGEVKEFDAETIVPGDTIWLESGNRVPADARLLSAQGLEVDESLLTGESIAVTKEAGGVFPELTAVGDRRNMAFAGSLIARGRAKAVVVETGSGTQVGQLALDVLGAAAGKPPLLIRLERFTRVVGFSVLIAATVVAILGVLIQDYSVSEMFMFAVALAVSAIPEGLPIAITVALAVAATRMAKRGVIVRKLGAVEGLGSCTMIASDKTGTLTCNELTLREIVLADGATLAVTGEGFVPTGQVLREEAVVERGESASLDALAMAAVLCSEADLHLRDGRWAWRGDPTDVALLSMAHKVGWVRETTLDEHPQVTQIPFEPELRFAASFNRVDDGVRVFVKGAPERVLEMCALDEDAGAHWHRRAEAMAERGFRVLAIAIGDGPSELEAGSVPPEPSRLTFTAFVGMIDPLRPGVREAVRACGEAGVSVSMVTGDHPSTALAIARDLGFAESQEQVTTGDVLAGLDAEELHERVGRSRVFARVAPSQKLDIVRAAQKAGHFVSVTGDGANDAPALRAANIGIAMGRTGTDVAREACDLVISDDNFATIVAGIEEGRVAYDNIRKVIFLLVSTGAAEVILVTLAVATGSPLPLLPAQLLWLNLVTNGIQDVALAFEPSEGDVLRRPPRSPRERIFNVVMIENCLFSALVMGVLGFVVFKWMLNAGWSEASARNGLLLLMVLFESVHIGSCRSETKSALKLSPLRSPILLAGAIGAFTVHLAMMYLPFGQAILGTEPVGIGTWFTLGAIALVLFVLVELHKLTWRWRPKSRPPQGASQERSDNVTADHTNV